MPKEYKVHYTYECWKCPDRHEGAAPVKADSPNDAEAEFVKVSADWPGLDGFEYAIEVTGVSWRP